MPTARATEELSRRTDRPLPSSRHQTRRQTELEWVRHHGWAPELLNAQDSVVALRRTGGVTVQRVQEQPEGDWVARIRAKLLGRGLNREWVHRFCDQVGRWSIYLFPLTHALGRSRLISATITRTNEDAQQ